MTSLTHVNKDGRAAMVDIAEKEPTARRAVAEGKVVMRAETLALALSGENAKGSVIRTAEIAGIMAAKKTADLIPLCHPLALSKVDVAITPDEALPGFRIRAEISLTGKTGVEMEALTAASVAALTIYDMLKAAQKDMVIGPMRLLEKSGGKSGTWTG